MNQQNKTKRLEELLRETVRLISKSDGPLERKSVYYLQSSKLEETISKLLSDARREERERCLEVICKRLDDLGDLCDHIPVWKSAIKNTVLSEGTRKALTTTEESIKKLK